MSKHSFTLDTFKLLNKGLNFCPSPPQYDKDKLQNVLRTFFRRIKLKAHFGTTEYKPTILQELKVRNNSFKPHNIDHTIQTFEIAAKADIEKHRVTQIPYHNLTKSQRYALKQLSERSDLVIT